MPCWGKDQEKGTGSKFGTQWHVLIVLFGKKVPNLLLNHFRQKFTTRVFDFNQ
jgi:hypothetical protein